MRINITKCLRLLIWVRKILKITNWSQEDSRFRISIWISKTNFGWCIFSDYIMSSCHVNDWNSWCLSSGSSPEFVICIYKKPSLDNAFELDDAFQWKCVAVRCSMLYWEVCCSAMQCVAVRSSALQCVAVCCLENFGMMHLSWWDLARHKKGFSQTQHDRGRNVYTYHIYIYVYIQTNPTATHCNTLQHTTRRNKEFSQTQQDRWRKNRNQEDSRFWLRLLCTRHG